MRFRNYFGTFLSLFLILLAIFAWWKMDYITDWWKFRQFTPTANLSTLVAQDGMTDIAKKYFYINHPEITSDRQAFGKLCPNAEKTIILGCYHSGENGIALYDIQDQRLEGVEQVTAAHETLHAAYERLSSGDKQTINTALENFYNNGLNDQRIKDTIGLYKQADPKSVIDEMHSIFGTEVPNLPPALETYYSKYFINRGQVVAYSNQYEAVFVQTQNQLKSLSAQIEQLKTELASQKNQIENEQDSLLAESRRLQTLQGQDQIEEYNAAVPGYNSRVQSLRAQIAAYNSKINQINGLVEQYNSLAVVQQSLYNALDSRVQGQVTR